MSKETGFRLLAKARGLGYVRARRIKKQGDLRHRGVGTRGQAIGKRGCDLHAVQVSQGTGLSAFKTGGLGTV